MESEKVKEIKKALEDNANYEHHDKLGYIDGYKCKTVAYADILTLINELESENERLSSRYRNLEINYNDTWEHYREYEVENQQLKDRIAELEKHIERVESERIRIKQDRDKKEELASKFIDSYNDSLKQFAERLKEKLEENIPFEGYDLEDFDFDGETIQESIDETLKEFINEQD
jgi:septal ring factor EnvC (AmiA/AmiB activator)